MSGADRAADRLYALAERAPRVHCITNSVAEAYSANLLLAVGAQPAMSRDPKELPQFLSGAASLLVNIGTLDEARRHAVEVAIGAATEYGIPWVLDPVMAERSEERQAYAARLLQRRPAVVRGNAAEIDALAPPGEGDAAQRLALAAGTVVAESGARDLLTDGRSRLTIGNGHPMMARVTAMGCAASALVAAFLAVENDPLEAAAAALLTLGVAGEIAGETASGPGSFAAGILDAVYRLERSDLVSRGDIA